ncbi:MAG: tyrosine-type recombinase/integrase [Eubacteriales bacterium]|nr:tyrosine-type recombinase/integrase [Eubacteriales bacterium]
MSDSLSALQLNNQNSSDNDIPLSYLKRLIDCGIIDLNGVAENIMTTTKVLKKHPYAITEPKDSNGYWRTHYIDDNGKRKDIKCKTKEELIKRLVRIYTGIENANKITFEKLFWEWLDYKKEMTSSANTIKRHIQHFNRYFKGSEMEKKPIGSISEIFLEKFCNSMVKDYNLSYKEWGNVKTILNKSFSYAVRMGYITDNIVPKIEITVRFRQIFHKDSSTQVFNTEEKKQLFKYLDNKYSETGDSSFMAVKLNFYLGLRVGELVSLKWSDISDDKIHIVREEIRNQQNNTVTVEEHTKTHTDRYVILVPTAKNILIKLQEKFGHNEYIFTRNGERITSRQIAYVLEKFAERTGVKVKSSHKMRKTYASTLAANGVSLDFIRQELGHSNLSTTLRYIYNPMTEQETKEKLCSALEESDKNI